MRNLSYKELSDLISTINKRLKTGISYTDKIALKFIKSVAFVEIDRMCDAIQLETIQFTSNK